jgi:hypothetical protein
MPNESSVQDARFIAAVDMIGRTGAKSFGVRYQDDEQSVVWLAVAEWGEGKADAAGALDPLRAVLRLCEQVVDGAQCTHCQRPAGLEPDSIETMPVDDLVCWYQFDPELATFRRGCEGAGAGGCAGR